MAGADTDATINQTPQESGPKPDHQSSQPLSPAGPTESTDVAPQAAPVEANRKSRHLLRNGGLVVLAIVVIAGLIIGFDSPLRHDVFGSGGESKADALAAKSSASTAGSAGATGDTGNSGSSASWYNVCQSAVAARRNEWNETDSLGNTSSSILCGYTITGANPDGVAAPAGTNWVNLVVAVEDTAQVRPAQWSVVDLVLAPSRTVQSQCEPDVIDGRDQQVWGGCAGNPTVYSLSETGAYGDLSGEEASVSPGGFSIFIVSFPMVPASISSSSLGLFLDYEGGADTTEPPQWTQWASVEGLSTLPL